MATISKDVGGVLVTLKVTLNANGEYVATFLTPANTAGHSQTVEPGSKTAVTSDRDQDCVYRLTPIGVNWEDVTSASQVHWEVNCSTT